MDFQSFYRSLSPDLKQSVDNVSQHRWLYAGQELMHQNAPSDDVFIIEDGVVEVIIETNEFRQPPPIAYLTRGDIIGELGVLNRQARTATIRAAADVYYRRIRGADFLGLLRDLPGFGLYLAERLAHRLAQTTTNLGYNSFCVDLSGRLPNFDLISVFFTIGSSGCTGELRIIDETKQLIGNFYFDFGRLHHARFRHLQGLEACWQAFLERELDGSFSFRHSDAPSRPCDPPYLTDIPINDLLVRAALLRDEFATLLEPLQTLRGSVERTTDTLAWNDAQFSEEASRLWSLLERGPVELRSLWPRCACSLATFGILLQKMRDTSLLRWIETAG